MSLDSLQRLKAQWQDEYETWKWRRLDGLEVVYVWADGLYVKAELEESKAALLVRIGALTDGCKIILAVESGQRESKDRGGGVAGSADGGLLHDRRWPSRHLGGASRAAARSSGAGIISSSHLKTMSSVGYQWYLQTCLIREARFLV